MVQSVVHAGDPELAGAEFVSQSSVWAHKKSGHPSGDRPRTMNGPASSSFLRYFFRLKIFFAKYFLKTDFDPHCAFSQVI